MLSSVPTSRNAVVFLMEKITGVGEASFRRELHHDWLGVPS